MDGWVVLGLQRGPQIQEGVSIVPLGGGPPTLHCSCIGKWYMVDGVLANFVADRPAALVPHMQYWWGSLGPWLEAATDL